MVFRWSQNISQSRGIAPLFFPIPRDRAAFLRRAGPFHPPTCCFFRLPPWISHPPVASHRLLSLAAPTLPQSCENQNMPVDIQHACLKKCFLVPRKLQRPCPSNRYFLMAPKCFQKNTRCFPEAARRLISFKNITGPLARPYPVPRVL